MTQPQQSGSNPISMRALLEAGVHFGHNTGRWNPKMKPYIFGARNGIYIIDLQKTVGLARSALRFVSDAVARGGSVLFVGTKKQARAIIQREADRCGMPFVNNRWLGGTLTNFATISKRIQYYNELSEGFNAEPEAAAAAAEAAEAEAATAGISQRQTKRERVMLQKEYERLTRAFSGLSSLERLPGAVFIVDPSMEEIAVREANRSKIPIVAMCDTNADPDVIDYPIPSNDDAIRAIQLMTSLVADAVREGVAVGEVEQQFHEAAVTAAETDEADGEPAAASESSTAPAAASEPATPSAAAAE